MVRYIDGLARAWRALGADELTAPWSAAPSAPSTCSAFRSHFSSPQPRKSWTPSSPRPTAAEERTPAEPLSGSNRDIVRVLIP